MSTESFPGTRFRGYLCNFMNKSPLQNETEEAVASPDVM